MAIELAPPQWHFVPKTLAAGSLPELELLFATLQARPLQTAAGLAQWLLDESELLSRIAAEQARRYVAMTCHTDDPNKRQSYLAMEQEVMPRVKVLADALDKRFLQSEALNQLDPKHYAVVIRKRRTQSEIFRAENTELQVKEAELQTQQQTIAGSITVEFDGKPHTLPQMAPYFESQDRNLREKAFAASLAARRQHWEKLEDTFDQLLALRGTMAKNAGFTNYTPYRFLELGRFDYGVQQCLAFHAAVENCVVPAVRKLDAIRTKQLALESLRPWDLEVDVDGRPPHRPFATQSELEDICKSVFHAVDPRFAAEFAVLGKHDLLDLMSRQGKAPGGYQYQLEDVRLPFIFANGVGLHQDVQTLLHEGGHAFHSLLCRHHDLLAFRDYPIEMAETASMSMELLGLENLTAAYTTDRAKTARKKHLEGILRTLTWIASIDAFQHWLYANQGHTRNQRRAAWVDIRNRFAPHIDWTGLQDAMAMQWVGQTHLFNHAFYYIEYGIAQIAALQVWRNYRSDKQAAVDDYRNACALGGSRPLPELFMAANVTFDLSQTMLQGLVEDVMKQMQD